MEFLISHLIEIGPFGVANGAFRGARAAFLGHYHAFHGKVISMLG